MATTPTVAPEQIVRIRKKLRETQREFGLRFGRTRVTISQWERGRAAPPPWAQREMERLDQVLFPRTAR